MSLDTAGNKVPQMFWYVPLAFLDQKKKNHILQLIIKYFRNIKKRKKIKHPCTHNLDMIHANIFPYLLHIFIQEKIIDIVEAFFFFFFAHLQSCSPLCLLRVKLSSEVGMHLSYPCC